MRASERYDTLPARPPFRLTSSSTVELREGGGWISLFGAPFFLAGAFLVRSVLRVVPVEGALSKGGRTLLLFALMSLVFLTVGSVLLFGRRWLTLDVASGSLVRSGGLLIPMWSERRRLSEFSSVVIEFEPGDSDSVDHYRVRLRAITAKDFLIYSPERFAESRAQGEFLSRFLRLPLADATTDHEVIVSAERASDTLQDRLRSSGPPIAMAEPPPAMQSEVDQSAGRATIIIPKRKSGMAIIVATFVSSFLMAAAIPAMWRFFWQTDNSVTSRFLFLGFFVLLLGILPTGAISQALGAIRSSEVVKASSAGIVIERRGAWRTRTTAVSAGDILDVDYSTFEGRLESARRIVKFPLAASTSAGSQSVFVALKKCVPTKGIIVKSRQGLVAFGEGLSQEELQFLKWVLTKALAG